MSRQYRHYSQEEKKQLIMKCRQSGLSDHQWCIENGINHSTFYNWIKKLRNVACTDISQQLRSHTTPIKQEVVKIDMLSMNQTQTLVTKQDEYVNSDATAIEVTIHDCTIKIHNHADPTLLANTINLLRGSLC